MSAPIADLEFDLAIVGGGIVGLGVGWKLARMGYEVLLLERGEVGAGASRAAGGMLAPTAEVQFHDGAMLELQKRSLEMYPEFVRDIEDQTGVRAEFRKDGTLVVALDRDDDEAVERVFHYQQSLGLEVTRLGADEVQSLEPSLSRVYSAVLCEDDHQVNNSHLVDALLIGFLKEGGTLSENSDVMAVHVEKGKTKGVVLSDGTIARASNVLVAAGAWSTGIENIPELAKTVLRPVRGQMIALDGGSPPLISRVVRGPDAYLVPKSDGSLIIGSTMEERGFDPSMTAGGIHDLLRGAWQVLPAIYEQSLRDMWTGFRPVTLDNHPILGPSAIPGLWIATGHSRHGILLAPITAHLMTEMIHTGHVPDYGQAFSPARMLR
ncbi:MAG: glycine oxidase ThiO [Bradymonadaceae bacterium]